VVLPEKPHAAFAIPQRPKRGARPPLAVRRAIVPLLLVLLAPLAHAQDNTTAPATPPGLPEGVAIVQGGEPGIRVTIDGTDVESAAEPGGAVAFDPSREANVSLSLAPPPGTTWEIRSFEVGLLLSGPGGTPPDALRRVSETNTSIPPGFTVYINRTVDLHAFKSIGAGLFLMEVAVRDASGGTLYAKSFYVHVKGNPFLTATGAAVTVASVATGYGLWQILRDLKELHKARQRHKRQEAERASRLGTLTKLAGAGLDLSAGFEGALSAAQDADKRANRLEKRRPVAWAATGLGLGGVGVSWAQFLGYVPLNVGNMLAWTFGVGALFLTVSLLAVAMYRRLTRRPEPIRTLTPEGPEPRPAPRENARPKARR
jgi:hypothetical protein